MRLPLLSLLLAAASAAPAAAQVGYPPASSPYRDIPRGHSVTGLVGRVGGGGGRFGIGPQDGTVFGLRYDVRAGGTVQFGVTFAQGNLHRYIVDPFIEVARRKSGPVEEQIRFADVSVQLNLSGAKTWHRLAPYTGVSIGVAFSDKVAQDTSGYRFGNKFYFAPQLGTRLFLTDRLHLRADVRGVFWKLTYPLSFTEEPVLDPGTLPNDPHAVITDQRLTEWTLTPWIQVGLGYSFTL
jgi:hypothetical protein